MSYILGVVVEDSLGSMELTLMVALYLYDDPIMSVMRTARLHSIRHSSGAFIVACLCPAVLYGAKAKLFQSCENTRVCTVDTQTQHGWGCLEGRFF